MLDNHKLVLQLSKRTEPGAGGGGGGAGKGLGAGKREEGSTKLVVRNVAFEATKK